MIKLLIISYYYPPANFVGAERIASFARHLHKFGVYPIIVTRNWNPNQTNTYEKIHENSIKHNIFDTHEEYYMPYHRSWRDRLFDRKGFLFSLLRRFLTAWELFVSSFWVSALPYRNLYIKSRELLTLNSDISVVIVSGSPFESFHFGYLLKKEFPHIHWIPGYRDEWTAFRRYPFNNLFESLIFKLNSYSEKKFTSNCSCFMSVSDDWVSRIGKFISKTGFTVMNGFEPSLESSLRNLSDNSKFVIAYSGSIYPNQAFEPIAKVLCELKEFYHNKISIEIQFYGVQSEQLGNNIKSVFEIEKVKCAIYPRISISDLHKNLENADFMFVTKYGEFNGFIPVKVFDYYNLAKPILLFPSDYGEVERFISVTQSGIIAHTIPDCYNRLKDYIDNKISGKTNFNLQSRISQQFYTREHQASILASHLHNLKELKS